VQLKRARLQELDEQYEEAARQAGYRWKAAWDRVYGSREAELDLIKESLAYHEAKDNAEYYGEHYEAARQVWLDPLLELVDRYSQPIRSQETRDLLQEWRERNT
jgi:hypothetical protein